jgi:hypothetical protein
LLIGILKCLVDAAIVEVAFKLGDMTLLAIVAAHLVKDLEKHGDEGVDLGLVDNVGPLVDVEQDAARRDRQRPLKVALEDRIIDPFQLGQEEIGCWDAIDFAVFQQVGQELQKVRFTGSEEARNPDTVGTGIVGIGVEEMGQPLMDDIGQDVFLKLIAQLGLVIGLDDTLDRAPDWFDKQMM